MRVTIIIIGDFTAVLTDKTSDAYAILYLILKFAVKLTSLDCSMDYLQIN